MATAQNQVFAIPKFKFEFFFINFVFLAVNTKKQKHEKKAKTTLDDT